MNDIHKADVQAIHHEEADDNIKYFTAYHFEIPLLVVYKGILAELLDAKQDSHCNKVWANFTTDAHVYLYPDHH